MIECITDYKLRDGVALSVSDMLVPQRATEHGRRGRRPAPPSGQCTGQVVLARRDNQAWAAGEPGCPVIAAPCGCRRPYKPCLVSQPRQASATSRQPESMVRE